MAQRREDGGTRVVVAVDTGGTFTDVVCLRGGELRVHKLPSTPDDPARAVLDGIRAVLGGDGDARDADDARDDGAGRDGGDGAATAGATPPYTLIHGSTVATNSLLERRGARVALVTNRGFEDVIEIGRQNRPQLYALVGHRPPPVVAPADRHGIAGRLGPDGEVIAELDADDLAALAARLGDAESIAICLLHSYANPEHEERVAEALAGLDAPLSISSRLLPEYREYERTATTVVNAYVAPRMERYLGRLGREAGARRVRIMGSGGGALPLARALREPVHTVLSGPAGGVVGALERARAAELGDILTFDMGGTSTDVSLCPGRPLQTREFEIAGLPVAVPVLDIHTVGAGGGSIAWIDAGGALRVGPRSAGADPGPICYGRGGTEVTVTDAHVWLGRLPADAFLGGEATLDRDAIAGPLHALADRLGLSPEATAEGVIEVANVAMEGALRVISVERGYDPAGFTLLPFGGAAALHAAELAGRLGVPRVLIPPDPGVLSAFGMLVSPVRKEAARTVLLGDDAAGHAALADAFAALEAEVVAAMAEEDIARDALEMGRVVDARYRGQSFELRVDADGWAQRFHQAHETRYGYALPDETVEAVTARVVATAGAVRPPAATAGTRGQAVEGSSAAEGGGSQAGAQRVEGAARAAGARGAPRDVAWKGERITATQYERAALPAGARIEGPAVLTEYSATTWLPPGWTGLVLRDGAVLAEASVKPATPGG